MSFCPLNDYCIVLYCIVLAMSQLNLPPVVDEDGSTASTATLCPRDVNILPNASM